MLLRFLDFSFHLQFVDETFLDSVLRCGVGGHAETFSSLSQLLLLLLTVRICCCTLGSKAHRSSHIKLTDLLK